MVMSLLQTLLLSLMSRFKMRIRKPMIRVINFSQTLMKIYGKPILNATWLPALTELRKISDAQKKDIETKFEKWHASVMPGATWLTYILIVLGVLLVAIVSVWIFRKGPKTTQKE